MKSHVLSMIDLLIVAAFLTGSEITIPVLALVGVSSLLSSSALDLLVPADILLTERMAFTNNTWR